MRNTCNHSSESVSVQYLRLQAGGQAFRNHWSAQNSLLFVSIFASKKKMHWFTFYNYLSITALAVLRECETAKGVYRNDAIVTTGNSSSVSRPIEGFTGVNNKEKVSHDVAISASVQEKLKAELEKDPFQQWQYKSRWSRMSDLKLDGNLVSKAIQPGDPRRLKKVLIKALKGHQINVMVIGGSNSAGGKLGVDEKSLNGLYFKVFTNWWNNTFGKVTKAFVKEYEVTIGGTGSYFFAFCYKTFIPKDTEIHLVLMEASINYNTRGKAEAIEQLTRQALGYPSTPAVLYINLVSGVGLNPETKKVFNPSCLNLENFGQTDLARYYAITSFSLKEVLCRKENNQWKAVVTDMAGSDGRHIGIKAHALVAILMIEYVRGVLRDALNVYNVNDALNYSPGQVNSEKENDYVTLPEPSLLQRKTEVLRQPLCWTGVTPDISQDLHRPNLQLQIVENDGFYPSGSMREDNVSDKSADLRTDAQGGWGTWQIYSNLKLRVYVPPFTSSPKTRSLILLTRTSGSGGKAEIWLDDDDQEKIYICTMSLYGQNRLDTVATKVEPGYHTISVRTVTKGNFLVSGVLVGPPDFQRRQVL